MENKNKELLNQKVTELIDLIKNTNDYKRYIEVKDIMKSNKEIMNLISKIKKIQQTIIKKENKKEDTSIEEERLKELKSELETYPIYNEYNYLQEDLNNLFQNVKAIIESIIKKINS